MRSHLRLIALSALVLVPASVFAQAVYFKSGNREERWEFNDPFAPRGTSVDKHKAVWKSDVFDLEKGGVTRSHKVSDVVRIDWPEPPLILKARESVERGDATGALGIIEPLLYKFDKLRKTPGSPWLKAAEVKLDALAQLSNATVLKAFITLLEENDDGTIPGLAAKLKLAKLSLMVREGDNNAVLAETDKLLAELSEPDTQARLHLFKADALFALRRYEDALNTYLTVPTLYGSEKSFVPEAYLGAAKALRAMDAPTTHSQRLDLASVSYLKDIIRDYPISKEAQAAKKLLPREERIATEKTLLTPTDKPAEKKDDDADDTKTDDAKPATDDAKPATDEPKTGTEAAKAPETPTEKPASE